MQKKKKKTNPQHFCVPEDCMLLEGGLLYGFIGFFLTVCGFSINPLQQAAVNPHEAL